MLTLHALFSRSSNSFFLVLKACKVSLDLNTPLVSTLNLYFFLLSEPSICYCSLGRCKKVSPAGGIVHNIRTNSLFLDTLQLENKLFSTSLLPTPREFSEFFHSKIRNSTKMQDWLAETGLGKQGNPALEEFLIAFEKAS